MKKKHFILNTITHWDEPPRARHQIAYALAKTYPVLFVSANRIGIPRFQKIKSADNLEIFQPYFFVSNRVRYRIPFLNRIYQVWLYRILKRSYPDSIVINFDFTARYLGKFFNKLVYYCNDDHIGISYKFNPQWVARYHDQCEQALSRDAKFCVGTSGFLASRLSEFNENSFEIRLGAPDIADFQFVESSNTADTSTINVGIVGYIGTIDFEILDYLLSKKDLFITLVGPISTTYQKRMEGRTNVKATGSLTGNRLYEEISRFEVGLIPYKINSTIDRTPNKLWLYMALGKPTVISNIKGIRNWEFPDHFVYRANSFSEFYNLIRLAASEDNDQLTQQRMAYAKQNTWETRMKYFVELCDKLI